MSTLLTLNNASLELNHKLCLHKLNANIASNGISIIMGANGAGKTLFLKLCAGIIMPTAGDINYASPLVSVVQHPQTTFVPQQPVLLRRSAAENIALPLRCSGADNLKQRVSDALEWAQISALATTPIVNLSVGQQQLVALARAWALQPKLLLLDEPCANLDPQRVQLIEQLIRTLDQQGCKIIMSSHNITQVKRLADDIIFMSTGTIIEHQNATAFFTQTMNADIQQFMEYSQ